MAEVTSEHDYAYSYYKTPGHCGLLFCVAIRAPDSSFASWGCNNEGVCEEIRRAMHPGELAMCTKCLSDVCQSLIKQNPAILNKFTNRIIAVETVDSDDGRTD